MGRKCLGCFHKDRAKLDAAISAGTSSARTIGTQFGIPKKTVLNHRQHIAAELQEAHSADYLGLKEIVKRFDRLISFLQVHLKKRPRSPLPLDWLREVRELRSCILLRIKALAKIAPSGDGQKREGDHYVISFIMPDGKPAQIPMKVYASLPKDVFEAAQYEQDCNSSSEATETKELLSDPSDGCNEDVTIGSESAARTGARNDE